MKKNDKRRQEFLLDVLYEVRSQTEVAKLLGTSPQRVSQLVRKLAGLKTGKAPERPASQISAALYQRDPRNRTWADTPAAMYKYERGLSQWEGSYPHNPGSAFTPEPW